MDIATKAEIHRVLHDHAANGGAFLVISSDLEEIARVSSRTGVIRSGNLVAALARGVSGREIAAAAIGG